MNPFFAGAEFGFVLGQSGPGGGGGPSGAFGGGGGGFGGGGPVGAFGGGGAGGPGVVGGGAGPVGAFGGGVGGPGVTSDGGPVGPFGPDGLPDGMPGEIIGVDPEIQRPITGESFFGINAPFYFWPRYRWWGWPYGPQPYFQQPSQRPLRMVCEKQEIEEGREVFICERAPGQPMAYYPVAYGAAFGWW